MGHHIVHNSRLLDFILSQLNSVHAHALSSFRILLNVTPTAQSPPNSPIRLSLNSFPTQNISTNFLSLEEWCFLGCYAVWLL
jgi:hypothetical protein